MGEGGRFPPLIHEDLLNNMPGISSPKPSLVSCYRSLDRLLNIYYYYYYYYYYYVGLDLVKDLLIKISLVYITPCHFAITGDSEECSASTLTSSPRSLL